MRDFVRSVGMTAKFSMQGENHVVEDVACDSDVIG